MQRPFGPASVVAFITPHCWIVCARACRRDWHVRLLGSGFHVLDDFRQDIDRIARIDAVPTILDVVCRTTGMGFAAVARVTDDRWIACSVLDTIGFGLAPGGELKVETTICQEVRHQREPIVIDNVSEDTLYRGHATPALYGFQSYISMPIIHRDGRFFGTLCAIDPRPARLNNPETIGMFRLFAELIASHLDTEERLIAAEGELVQERDVAELREKFVAVLGHDLRNPIAAIESGLRMLARNTTDERGRTVLTLIHGSLARISGLVDNVLDFARARMGDGMSMHLDARTSARAVLEHVVSEARAVHPERTIDARFEVPDGLAVDHARLAQVLSNLVANALTHGDDEAAVSVGSGERDGRFELWVTNAGAPIPAAMIDALFRPFVRGSTKRAQQGLGLGLYIASEIARAHGGTIGVTSTADETRFTFSMPVSRRTSQSETVAGAAAVAAAPSV